MEFEELKIEIPVTKDSDDDDEENLSSIAVRSSNISRLFGLLK